MKNLTYKYKINKPFGNLYRDKTILLIIKNSEGKYLFGSKPDFYPKGITRLLGGGIDEGEDLIDAAIREAREELNIDIKPNDLQHKAILSIQAEDNIKQKYKTEINIIIVNIPIDEYRAGDDVKRIVLYDEKDIKNLVERYRTLSEDNWYKGEEGEFCWEDFGKVYGDVHEVIFDIE